MAAILSAAKGSMDLFAKPIGDFAVQMGPLNREQGQPDRLDDRHNLHVIGLFFNNIVASCTFRPPATASELRVERGLLAAMNGDLYDGFLHFEQVQDFKSQAMEGSEGKKALITQGRIYQGKVEELQRHQEAFNPIGGLMVGGATIFVALTFFTWLSNTFVPYSMRDNSKFMAKCIAGSSAGFLTKEAVEGWARHTDGGIRAVNLRPCDGYDLLT